VVTELLMEVGFLIAARHCGVKLDH